MGARKHLSADALIRMIRENTTQAKQQFPALLRTNYSWTDCIMSGLAIFGFKEPSLLTFEQDLTDNAMLRRNLRTLYGVAAVPSDTQLRARLDEIDPRLLRVHFKTILARLQRGKALESYRYLEGHYLVSIDGTGQFYSKSVHCDHCCEKKHQNGEVGYYHPMLGAVLVHPEHREVFPFAPEPIIKGDGTTKNDCERNASKRLLADLRREHPHLKMLVVADGLAANYPHLSYLDSLRLSYIVTIKPGDHRYLLNHIAQLSPRVHQETDSQGTLHQFRVFNDVPLNESHQAYQVTVVDYTETKANGKTQHFTWATRLKVSPSNVYQVMRAARARWRIENETFNTLKNQGYHFNHNYGHGYKNLCSVMSMLMMLSFFIDQVQQFCCRIYQQARIKTRVLRELFSFIRALIKLSVWENWSALYQFIGEPEGRAPPGTPGGLAYMPVI